MDCEPQCCSGAPPKTPVGNESLEVRFSFRSRLTWSQDGNLTPHPQAPKQIGDSFLFFDVSLVNFNELRIALEVLEESQERPKRGVSRLRPARRQLLRMTA